MNIFLVLICVICLVLLYRLKRKYTKELELHLDKAKATFPQEQNGLYRCNSLVMLTVPTTFFPQITYDELELLGEKTLDLRFSFICALRAYLISNQGLDIKLGKLFLVKDSVIIPFDAGAKIHFDEYLANPDLFKTQFGLNDSFSVGGVE